MRTKSLLLALLLTWVAGLSSPPADAAGTHPCPVCTTYPDGSTCCVGCVCNGAGQVIFCTDNYCPPPNVE